MRFEDFFVKVVTSNPCNVRGFVSLFAENIRRIVLFLRQNFALVSQFFVRKSVAVKTISIFVKIISNVK